jgi:multicomponent K+:H+ antiporter subunit D
LIVLPVVLPLVAGALLLLGGDGARRWHLAVSVLALLAQGVVALGLLSATADGSVLAYLVGNWPAPFGIALVVDRLTVMMLLLTVLVAGGSLLASLDQSAQAPGFHGLLQLQLCGLNGAFLTADLFNLFVFFEVLLAASYALLLLGSCRDRFRAATHYVVVNLAASALFLFAAGLLYGVAGTLNLADLALRVAAAPQAHAPLLRAGGFLLLVVFAVKAALLPLYFWLPLTYRAATLPVVTLFAIMTKVGVYAIARVLTLVFGAAAGPAAVDGEGPLLWLSLATVFLAGLGTLAAGDLRTMVSYVVVASAGTMVAGLVLGTEQGVAAALFYMTQATVAAAAMFAITGFVGAQRGAIGDRLMPGPALPLAAVSGGLFFAGAVAIIGLPPLAGFVAKALLIVAALDSPGGAVFIATLLVSALLVTAAFARAGSMVFWKVSARAGAAPSPRSRVPVRAAVMLLAAGAGIAVLPAPVHRYAEEAAAQLLRPSAYIAAVLALRPMERLTPREPGEN